MNSYCSILVFLDVAGYLLSISVSSMISCKSSDSIKYGNMCATDSRGRSCLCLKPEPEELKYTSKYTCGPASLHLSQGVDGSQSVDEAHHGQCWSGQPRREDVAVETQPVATLSLQVWGQEGEAVVVTRGEHHHIYLDGKTTCTLTSLVWKR